MLTIRKQQMDVFQSASDGVLSGAVAAWLRQCDPETHASTSDQTLLRRVDWGVRRARHWKLADECSIAIFVSLLFRIGPRFDQHPEVARYFQDSTRTPDQNLVHLVQNFNSWTVVRAQGARDSWETN